MSDQNTNTIPDVDDIAERLAALEKARDARNEWLSKKAVLEAALANVRAAHAPQIAAARLAYDEAVTQVLVLADEQEAA